ncbi:MAG: hypothetical protein U0Q22_16665 [Acidimicrobiales bacterium]
MNENPDRVAGFQAEIEAMKVKATGGRNETRLLALGIALGVAGLALAIYGGIMVQNDANEYNQRAFMATGSFIGLAMIIGGAALFVRYSMARYLRFWLIRLVHESRANADRIVDAIDRAAGPR